MKHLRTLIIFLCFFGLIFAFLNIKISPSTKAVLKCDGSKISKIIFTTNNSNTPGVNDEFYLEAYGGSQDWLLRSGDVRKFADRDVIQKMQTLLCHLPYVEKFENVTPEDLNHYGLTQPRRDITIDKIHLLIGSDTPTTTEFYVQTSDNPQTVYIVSNSFFPQLTTNIPDLMERHFLDRLKENTDAVVTIQRDGKTTELPHDMINLLRAQSFSRYHGPVTEEKTLEYGMSVPDYTLALDKSETYDMAFFGGNYYARLKLGNSYYVLILDPTNAQALWTQINALQN